MVNKRGELKNTTIHPSAIVETNEIAEWTRIWAFAHVLEGAKIGKNCNICDHTFIERGVVIGDNVTIKSGVYLWEGIEVDDEVFIGPNASFTNDIRPRSKVYPPAFLKTHIMRGASIGANATILCGITIGAYAMIGAGAVVTKDVPSYALVYGNPGQIKGYVCECGETLQFTKNEAHCICKKKYTQSDGVVTRE